MENYASKFARLDERRREIFRSYNDARSGFVSECRRVARALEEEDCDEVQEMERAVVELTRCLLGARLAEASRDAVTEVFRCEVRSLNARR